MQNCSAKKQMLNRNHLCIYGLSLLGNLSNFLDETKLVILLLNRQIHRQLACFQSCVVALDCNPLIIVAVFDCSTVTVLLCVSFCCYIILSCQCGVIIMIWL